MYPSATATSFFARALDREQAGVYAPPDEMRAPEFIAGRIVEGARTEAPEVFMEPPVGGRREGIA